MMLDQESILGALRQAAVLAVSGFLFMSGLAAFGSGGVLTPPAGPALDASVWTDTRSFLAHPDQAPGRRGAYNLCTPNLPAQLARAERSSVRASSTSGCGSPTRSSSSASTSSSRAAASDDRSAAMSTVAYSSFAPVAKR